MVLQEGDLVEIITDPTTHESFFVVLPASANCSPESVAAVDRLIDTAVWHPLTDLPSQGIEFSCITPVVATWLGTVSSESTGTSTGVLTGSGPIIETYYYDN